MKTSSSHEPDFVHSTDLVEAARRVLGGSDWGSIDGAMRNPKTRQLIRAEQYRMAMQQKAKSIPQHQQQQEHPS